MTSRSSGDDSEMKLVQEEPGRTRTLHGCPSLRCQRVGLLRVQRVGKQSPQCIVRCDLITRATGQGLRPALSHPLIYIPSSSQDLQPQQSQCLLQLFSHHQMLQLICAAAPASPPSLSSTVPLLAAMNNEDTPCRTGEDSRAMMWAKGRQK